MLEYLHYCELRGFWNLHPTPSTNPTMRALKDSADVGRSSSAQAYLRHHEAARKAACLDLADPPPRCPPPPIARSSKRHTPTTKWMSPGSRGNPEHGRRRATCPISMVPRRSPATERPVRRRSSPLGRTFSPTKLSGNQPRLGHPANTEEDHGLAQPSMSAMCAANLSTERADSKNTLTWSTQHPRATPRRPWVLVLLVLLPLPRRRQPLHHR